MESFSPANCSADGGKELTIIGSNLSAQARVVFFEKGPGALLSPPTPGLVVGFERAGFVLLFKICFCYLSDGRSLWEVEARVLPDRSSTVSKNYCKTNINKYRLIIC